MQLFHRAKKYPQLTGAGQALLVEAKAVIDKMDGFKARARAMAEGLEPELSAVIDVMYPMAALTKAVGFFRETYPARRSCCTSKLWAPSSRRGFAESSFPVHAVYRKDAPPGPAGRAFIEQLRQG